MIASDTIYVDVNGKDSSLAADQICKHLTTKAKDRDYSDMLASCLN